MGVCPWKKIIAIGVIVAFVWASLAWAAESNTPQFQEKAGTPVVKKHKKFPVLLVLLGAAAIGAGVYFLTKTKEDDKEEKYTIILSGRNVENNDEVVGGDITFKLDNGNTVTGSNSSSLVLEGSNKIVDASVSGQGDYFPGYIVFRSQDGSVLGYKDANGMKSFTISNGQRVIVEYIKNAGFDIKLFGQCLNKNTVKGYDKEIPVGIMNDGAEPKESDYTNLNKVISEFNKYSKVKMVFVGKVSALLDKGITVRIGNYTAGHWEKYSGNNITNSEAFMPSGADLSIHLEEEVQAALGGGDGPYPTWPGRSVQSLNDFGKRAISLNYSGLPFGFVISGDSIPSDVVSPMSSSSLNRVMQGFGSLPGSKADVRCSRPENKPGKE